MHCFFNRFLYLALVRWEATQGQTQADKSLAVWSAPELERDYTPPQKKGTIRGNSPEFN